MRKNIIGMALVIAFVIIAVKISSSQTAGTHLTTAFAAPVYVTKSPLIPSPIPPPPGTPTPQPTSTRLPTVGMAIELTQGVQVFHLPENQQCTWNPIFCNNSMPMVTGRPTVLRFYPQANLTLPIPLINETIDLRLDILYEDTIIQNFGMSVPAGRYYELANQLIEVQRIDLQNGLSFYFGQDLTQRLIGSITFRLVQLGTGQEAILASLTKVFEQRKAITVEVLPVEVIKLDGTMLKPNLEMDFGRWLVPLLPVPSVNITIASPSVINQGDGIKTKRGLLAWANEIYANRPAPKPDQLVLYVPWEYNADMGGLSDPSWCSYCDRLGRVVVVTTTTGGNLSAPRILAHEIIHNLGPWHAPTPLPEFIANNPIPCGEMAVSADTDPGWPYSGNPTIQEVGIDLSGISGQMVYPPQSYDIMSVCYNADWIAPATYKKIFDSPLLLQ